MPPADTPFGACVINLDRSDDRRAAMRVEFARAGLAWRRVPGVLPTAVPDGLRGFFEDAPGHRVASLTPGEVGCFAAHLSIMARMASGEFEPVMLVLEDDCVLPEGLDETLRGLLGTLAAGWDMVRLCNTPKRAYVPMRRLPSGHVLIRYSTIPNFTGAYLVSLAGARKLLASGPKTLPFDHYLREAWRHGSDVFGVWPPMVTQLDRESCLDRIDEAHEVTRAGLTARAEPAGFRRRIAWQIGTLGLRAWAACLAVNVVDAAVRRLARRTIIHRAASLMTRPGIRSTPDLGKGPTA